MVIEFALSKLCASFKKDANKQKYHQPCQNILHRAGDIFILKFECEIPEERKIKIVVRFS